MRVDNLKVVFVGGPYFGDGKYETIDKNIKEAEEYSIALANRGIPHFCAHTHTAHFEVKAKAPEPHYYALDLAMLRNACSAYLAMPRWKDSRGARFEHEESIKLGLPIFYPKSPEDLDEVEAWYRIATQQEAPNNVVDINSAQSQKLA